MPLEIDPKWEYWTPNEEISEILDNKFVRLSKIDLIENSFFDEDEEQSQNTGFRFGYGDPDNASFKLKRYKKIRKERSSYLKTCKCGRLFPDTGKSNYCSQECRSKFVRPKRSDICPQCNKTFYLNYSSQGFCSKKCYAESMMKHPFAQGCLNCGHTIPPSKQRNKKQAKVFCCKDCKVQFGKRKSRRRKDERKKLSRQFIVDSTWEGWRYVNGHK